MFKFNGLSLLIIIFASASFTLNEHKGESESNAAGSPIPLEVLGKLHPQTQALINTQINEIAYFAPVSSVVLQDRVFYFSKIIRSPDFWGHDYVVMYTKSHEKVLVPRLIYKSSTAGGFRVCPGVMLHPSVYLSKGNYHYTQETKLVEEIILHLEMMDSWPAYQHRLEAGNYKGVETSLLSFFDILAFSGSKARREKRMEVIDGVNTFLEMGLDTYDQEMGLYAPADTSLSSYLTFPPGEGFTNSNKATWGLKAVNVYDAFKNLEFSGFSPDFTAPVRNYIYSHAVLGLTKVYVFLGKLDEQDVEWHFAHDKQNRVWIERISFAKKIISSYGLSDQLINSGLLTHKPIEQRPQVILLINDVAGLRAEQMIQPFLIDSKDVGIYDITPLLDELKPIQDFRKAMGINR